jgi:hypothetical protein
MDFVWMQDDRIARTAILPAATVVEALHAAQRQAQRVGVVPVRVISVAAEEGLDPLDAVRAPSRAQPVAM